MKATTLWQPWASLCALGVKTIETRSWPAPKGLIGHRIAIHAAQHVATLVEPIWHAALLAGLSPTRPYRRGHHNVDIGPARGGVPLGAVVGTAVLTDCVPMVATGAEQWRSPRLVLSVGAGDALLLDRSGFDDLVDVSDQLPFGVFAPGRWAWLLADAEQYDRPIPAVGRQGIWNWEQP